MNIFENLDKMDNFLENRIHQEQLKKKNHRFRMAINLKEVESVGKK